jgi:drug/metabolite transporter (DMT)-like permease
MMRGYLMVLASTLLLSTTGLLIRYLLDSYHIATPALAFLRVGIVALAMGLGLLIFRPSLLRVQLRHLPALALMGFAGVGLHQVVWITSVRLNGVGVATVLVYIQPAIVALVAWRAFAEPLNRTKVAALALTMVGVVLVSRALEGGVNLNPVGLLAGVGTGFTWGTYALVGHYTGRRYSGWTSLFYAFLFGALLLLPLQVFETIIGAGATPELPLPAEGWAVILLLALGPTLGGFALYTLGLARMPAGVVTLIGTLEPVFTIVWAYFLFGEQLDAAQMLGAGLILWSVMMLRPRGRDELSLTRDERG